MLSAWLLSILLGLRAWWVGRRGGHGSSQGHRRSEWKWVVDIIETNFPMGDKGSEREGDLPMATQGVNSSTETLISRTPNPVLFVIKIWVLEPDRPGFWSQLCDLVPDGSPWANDHL